MAVANYSNREVDRMLTEIKKQVSDNHTETMERIGESDRKNNDKQVTMLGVLGEVNNKVTDLSSRTTDLEKKEQFRNGVLWAFGIIITLLGIPVLLLFVEAFINHKLFF